MFAESERPASDDASTASTSSVDRIFGMKTVQRTQCLTGAPDERLRHSRTFQVWYRSILVTRADPHGPEGPSGDCRPESRRLSCSIHLRLSGLLRAPATMHQVWSRAKSGEVVQVCSSWRRLSAFDNIWTELKRLCRNRGG